MVFKYDAYGKMRNRKYVSCGLIEIHCQYKRSQIRML